VEAARGLMEIVDSRSGLSNPVEVATQKAATLKLSRGYRDALDQLIGNRH